MTEEPTQQIRRPTEPRQVNPPLPPGLDPTRGRRPGSRSPDDPTADPGTEPTGVLHLDELFATEPESERHIDRPSVEDAPTWTAMPIVPVRSEPYNPPAAPPPTAPPPHLTGPPVAPRQARVSKPRASRPRARAATMSSTTARRLSTDLAAARRHTDDVLRSIDTWLRRDDNALVVLTGVIACILILIVAAGGH